MTEKELYPEDKIYKNININITLDDEDDMSYSVSCPEWVYIMPTKNPAKVVQSIISMITAHNTYTKSLKSGDVSTKGLDIF